MVQKGLLRMECLVLGEAPSWKLKQMVMVLSIISASLSLARQVSLSGGLREAAALLRGRIKLIT